MTKPMKSFKSYIAKKKWMEEKKLQAEARKEANKVLATAEIFVSDRSDAEREFHAIRGLK